MKERQEALNQVMNQVFDVLVVGGGLLGAALAQNAAARGLSVLLLEQEDFSANRRGPMEDLFSGALPTPFLKDKQAKQLSKEQEKLLRIAPHLVKDMQFVVPFEKDKTISNLKTSIAVGLKNPAALLNETALSKLVPVLSKSNGFQYTQAYIDSNRLIFALLQSASILGALPVNYVEVTGLENLLDGIQTVNCRDRNTGKKFEIRCRVCLNAAGPDWRRVAGTFGENSKLEASEREALYLIVKASAFETNSALLMMQEDDAYTVLLPWMHAILIGHKAGSSKRQYQSDGDEIEYLLAQLNSHLIDSAKLSACDVKYSFRTLELHDEEQRLTGRVESYGQNSGFFSARGVCISNYRTFADEIMDKVEFQNPYLKKGNSPVNEIMLGAWNSKDDFLQTSLLIETKAKKLSISPACIRHLICNYGAGAEHVIDLVAEKPDLKERILRDYPPILAELPYAFVNEMTLCLSDFLVRRSRLALLDPESAMKRAPELASLLSEIFGFDENRKIMELSALASELGFQQSAAAELKKASI